MRRDQVRDVDRRAVAEYGMSSLVLMENAGRGCADVLLALGAPGPVAIICGKGNNGGDGFVIARHLSNHGVQVRVVLTCQHAQLMGDAATNLAILRQMDLPVTVVAEPEDLDVAPLEAAVTGAEWIVDALLGTGAQGAPRSPADSVLRMLNEINAKKMAVDLPSGLDCDTGDAFESTFRADYTCTLVAAKPGLLTDSARPYVGAIHVVDIGVPRKLIVDVATSDDR